MRTRVLRTALILIGVAFFATPLTLLLAGVHARAFENRALADPPKLSQGWKFFPQATRYLIDSMPLRELAVRTNSKLWTRVFHSTPPYGRGFEVVLGHDGWLYLRDDVDNSCRSAAAIRQSLERWEQLIATIRRSGRRAVVLVAPDKTTIYPEHLPASASSSPCVRHGHRELWQALAGSGRAGVVGLRGPILALKRRTRDPLYKTLDTHWTDRGALELVRTALRDVGGGVSIGPHDVFRVATVDAVGDLTILLGDRRSERVVSLGVTRDLHSRFVPGSTLFVSDSFGYAPKPLLQPYFTNFHFLQWGDTSPDGLAKRIENADTLIFETVERDFTLRTAESGTDSGPITARLLSLLDQHLPPLRAAR